MHDAHVDIEIDAVRSIRSFSLNNPFDSSHMQGIIPSSWGRSSATCCTHSEYRSLASSPYQATMDPKFEDLQRLNQWYRDLMGSHIQLAIIGLSLRCVTSRPKGSGGVIHVNIRHLWSWFYYRQITTRYLPKMRWIALLHELTCLELYAHLPNLTATS